jgi:hypothetical protein
MRITKQLLLCVCCLGIAVPTAWGQAANSQATTGILGYLDPHSGAFRPVPPEVEDDASLPAATVVGGTVTVTITITVKTAGLTNFTCSANVSVFDGTTSPTTFEETNTVAATGTGSTRTCKLSIPYSWSLTTPTSDSMMTGYTVSGTTGTTGLPQRTSLRSPLDSRKVPANGAITALTAAVTQ